jgi:hypothetical protein
MLIPLKGTEAGVVITAFPELEVTAAPLGRVVVVTPVVESVVNIVA